MTDKKYKITKEKIKFEGHTLYRIEAVTDFGPVRAGEKGGYVESERNLSHEGNCWITDNGKVMDNARVMNDAWIYDNAVIRNNAQVRGVAVVCDWAIVMNDAVVCDFAIVKNFACIVDGAYVGKYAYISGYDTIQSVYDFKLFDINNVKADVFVDTHITYICKDKTWVTCMFYGSGEDFIKHAYKRSKDYGMKCEKLVKSVEEAVDEYDVNYDAGCCCCCDDERDINVIDENVKYYNIENSEDDTKHLPVSWEDYCKSYPIKHGECFINIHGDIISSMGGKRDTASDKIMLRDKKTAEAFVALMQLIQLRDCYRRGWVPDWTDEKANKYGIVCDKNKIEKVTHTTTQAILSFADAKTRDEFIKNLIDLIEKAKILL